MASTWSAGERADAHQVVGVLREKFARHEKKASREFVADYFRAVGATSVLDLWGGGASADALRAAMPDARIVSVENGDVCDKGWFSDRLGRKITKARLRRAHLIAAEEGGYEAAWGDVAKALAEPFDAVWLDFCAQWSPTMRKLVLLARGTQHLAITVMPERDGLGALGYHDRLIGLSAIIADYADMPPCYIGSYQRNDLGQDMALMIFDRPTSPATLGKDLRRRGAWSAPRFDKRRSMMLLRCSDCGSSFTITQSSEATTANYRGRRLCDSCRPAKRYRTPGNLGGTCEGCGERFEGAKRRFCTRLCRERSSRPPKAPCRICGTALPLGRRTLCSDLCRVVSEGRRPDRHASEAICLRCGAAFLRTQYGQRLYCSFACRRPKRIRREQMTAQARTGACLACGATWAEPPRRGRHRLYCGPACRRRYCRRPVTLAA